MDTIFKVSFFILFCLSIGCSGCLGCVTTQVTPNVTFRTPRLPFPNASGFRSILDSGIRSERSSLSVGSDPSSKSPTTWVLQ